MDLTPLLMVETAIGDSFQTESGFDVYDIPDALNPEAPQNGSFFMNGMEICPPSSPE